MKVGRRPCWKLKVWLDSVKIGRLTAVGAGGDFLLRSVFVLTEISPTNYLNQII